MSDTSGIRGMLFMTLVEGIHYMREEPRVLPKTRTYFNTIEDMDSVEFRSHFRVSRGGLLLVYIHVSICNFWTKETYTSCWFASVYAYFN